MEFGIARLRDIKRANYSHHRDDHGYTRGRAEVSEKTDIYVPVPEFRDCSHCRFGRQTRPDKGFLLRVEKCRLSFSFQVA